MAVLRTQSFGGVMPRVSPRALPPGAAQTAHNLDPSTSEFRPLAQDTEVIAASGFTNPLTIFRLQRNADGSLNTNFSDASKWRIHAGDVSYVKAQVNSDVTDRHYYSFDDGSAPPRVVDALGDDRQLGVPKPTSAPTINVNVVDEFTTEERSAAIDEGIGSAVTAIKNNLTAQGSGAPEPGGTTAGYLTRSVANGFEPENKAQQMRLYRLSSDGGVVSDAYSTIAASEFSWVLDPSLGPVRIDFETAAPTWAGGTNTPHIALAFHAYAQTYDFDSAAAATALAAIGMPGKTDGTKLLTSDQVTELVAQLALYFNPDGDFLKPKLDNLRTKVQEFKGLLDGGQRTSLVAMTTAFYSKSDVAAEITSALSAFAEKVWQAADDVARSSLPNDYAVSAGP
ncbi:MAG: hypothetical protein KF686_03330 [Ramlibacter sp.]|nr:hypothetical protein [Ramlibacter sp.]